MKPSQSIGVMSGKKLCCVRRNDFCKKILSLYLAYLIEHSIRSRWGWLCVHICTKGATCHDMCNVLS